MVEVVSVNLYEPKGNDKKPLFMVDESIQKIIVAAAKELTVKALKDQRQNQIDWLGELKVNGLPKMRVQFQWTASNVTLNLSCQLKDHDIDRPQGRYADMGNIVMRIDGLGA